MRRTGLLLFAMLLTGCNLSESPPEEIAIIVTSPPTLTCEQIEQAALKSVIGACAETESNEACYGYRQVTAEFQTESGLTFAEPGDMVDVAALRGISTSPLSEAQQTWGIAIVNIQANASSGQYVTFLLFGEATLDGITPDMKGLFLNTGSSECAGAPPSALLVQSQEDVQVTFSINGADITLDSTVYITAAQNQMMSVAALDGTVVVAAFDSTRILRPGAQVSLPLGTDDGLHVAGAPSEPAPFDIASIQRAPLTLLERPVQLPSPIAGPTIAPVESTLATSTVPPLTLLPSPTSTPEECTAREDWTASYTVARGDNLTSIARRFGISLRELQEGNCIDNPNLIRVGQVLRVPAEPPTAEATLTLASTAIATSTPADFRADDTVIEPGQCTTLRWDADNAASVYLDNETVAEHDQREVCPAQTTVYRLVVVQADGRQVPYTLTVEVAPEQKEEASSG